MSRSIICYDHLGNKYASKTEMAKAYNISYSVLATRLHAGWPLKIALTTSVKQGIKIGHNNIEIAKKERSEKANNRLMGQIFTNAQNKKAKVIDIKGTGKNKFFLMEFCDDKVKKEYRASSVFLGRFPKPEDNYRDTQKHLGEIRMSNYGYEMQIIEYKDSKNIIVKVEDKYTFKTNISAFNRGIIPYDITGKLKLIGFKNTNNQGLSYTVIDYENSNKILIKFEDNALLSISSKQLASNAFAHPLIKSRGKNLICGNISGNKFKKYKNKTYYKCQCSKCNWKHRKLLTAQQFLQHGKECV